MIRPFMTAAVLASFPATTVQAQTAGGPPIAYVKRVSNGEEIQLISPDGSERLLVYKARSKISISMMDLKPGGGEVAFTENSNALKILAFDNLGRPLPGNPREIRRVSSPCTIESPDYHPTDGSLLFIEGCGRTRAVWTVQGGALQRDQAPLFGSLAVFRARWSRLGDFVYHLGLRDGASSVDPSYLNRFALADSAHVELGVITDWSTFDVARVGEKVFWGGNDSFVMLDFSSGSTTSDAVPLNCPRGSRMTRSPDDTQMVFQSPWARGKGNYVMIGVTSCSVDPNALTGAGSWGWTDWRTDAPPPPPPATQTCPDGSVILATEICPQPPAP